MSKRRSCADKSLNRYKQNAVRLLLSNAERRTTMSNDTKKAVAEMLAGRFAVDGVHLGRVVTKLRTGVDERIAKVDVQEP